MKYTRIYIVLLLISIFSCITTQKCSLTHICYKTTEKILDRILKPVCVCPFAPCIQLTNPCPGYENIQFDGIAKGTALPAGIFKEWGTLNAISIHNGPPVNITQDLFKSQRPNLKILELDTFSIENIEVGAFQGFRTLEILDIRPFKLNIIRRNTFRGLSTLKVLKLYSGNVRELQPGAFNGLDKLERLRLSNNNIERIPKGLFDNLVELVELELSFNQIHRIDPFAFSQLSNIHTLECYNTKMQKLTPEILDGLQSIRTLNFGKNMINTIEIGTFSEMENLENLILSKNNLTTFSLIDLYLPLPDLVTLDLESNQIDDILFPTNSEYEEPLLSNLTKFILNGNKLEAVPRIILDYAPVLYSGYAPVPISCECHDISNVTDPLDTLVPSMSCPHTCILPKVQCTPTTIDLIDINEMPLIIITCNVTGNPTPSVTWTTPNGAIILGDYNPWDGVTNLYLSDLKTTKTGQYICHVRNRAGVARSGTAINLLKSKCTTNLPNVFLVFLMMMLIVVQ